MPNEKSQMKPLISILLLFAFQKTVFCQDKILLADDFNNNSNHWKLVNDSNFLVEIKHGVLHIQKFQKNSIQNGCLWYSKPIDGFDTHENFSIAFYAKYISGGDIFDDIDLQWGKLNSEDTWRETPSLYQLSFMYRGEIHLNYFSKEWTYLIRKDTKDLLNGLAFNPYKINKYELIQKDGFVIVKVNDKEFFKQLTPPIDGNSIGFQQCMKNAWEIDKIIVKQLSKNIDTTITLDTLPVLPDTVLKNNALRIYPNPFKNIFYVVLDLPKDESVKISMFDINGTLIQEHTRTIYKGFQKIDLYADVPAGSYVIKVELENSQVLSKIIIKQ